MPLLFQQDPISTGLLRSTSVVLSSSSKFQSLRWTSECPLLGIVDDFLPDVQGLYGYDVPSLVVKSAMPWWQLPACVCTVKCNTSS